jgi:hypothetical protein
MLKAKGPMKVKWKHEGIEEPVSSFRLKTLLKKYNKPPWQKELDKVVLQQPTSVRL